jgi:hypothetical protein
MINNMGKLYSVIRKGDVVLVEGQSEISRMIKLFTQSFWSHAALYVGDELLKREGILTNYYIVSEMRPIAWL